jgi:Tol biopolymer transport system component
MEIQNPKQALAIMVVVWFILSGTLPLVKAQPEDYNHPELKWYSIETEHFFIHFHDGAERTARVVAKVAEDVYEPITSLYLYKPKGKFHFIIRDHDDYSNGAAFFYDNKIEIWASPMKFDLRGTHNWLRNVVTHEFTHMISLQSARKITQRIPAIYLQAIGYEDDRRQDVLHGGPNVITSYPLAMTVIPGWFAEGIAQYQVPGLGYDTWDSHRDMILRTATLDNKLLTYNEMGVFGKNGLGNEKVYNHGYSFVSYLADKYGLATLREIAGNMKGFFRFTLDGAIKKATGKEARELYREWTNTLKFQYTRQTRDIIANQVEGTIIVPKGLANLHPVWSPDGAKIAYITNRENDYLSQTELVIRDFTTGKTKGISRGVNFSISWSPDGSRIAYANKSARSKGGSRFFDIYLYDLKRNKERRLTKGLRAHSPNWSKDGKHLLFIVAKDGTDNLAVMTLKDSRLEYITNFENGEQIHNPQWSPNKKVILFAISRGNGQDLYLMDFSTKKLTALLEDKADSRDAVFSPDGRKIYFSWDKTGIFNIYSKNLYSDEILQWTNVIGGAFMPSLSPDGDLAFSLFTSDGYKIAILKNPAPVDESKSRYLTDANGVKFASVESTIPEAMIEKINVQNFDDSRTPEYKIKPYSNHFSPIAFLPRIMIDYGTLKIGSYFYSSDVLNKYGFIAGFDFNKRGDYDLFALFEYRNFGPTLFVEAYNKVEHTRVEVDSVELIRRRLFKKTSDKFRYNLVEVDAGVRFKLSDSNELRAAFIFSRYSNKVKFLQFGQENTFGFNYFIGRDLSLKLTHRSYRRSVHSEINPTGRYVSIGYDYEFNKFLIGFQVDDPFNPEIFKRYNYNKLTLAWKENRALPIKNHSINFDLQAGYISTQVDSFFNFFSGGLWGNRGYPYFSIEGRKLLLGRFTYRFPLADHLDIRFMHLYFDKVFLGVFYDYGNAFNGNLDFSEFKSSLGLQLRLESFSFYSYPTKFSIEAAYGLDKFENANQIYGKEWRFYFGLAFGFLD